MNLEYPIRALAQAVKGHFAFDFVGLAVRLRDMFRPCIDLHEGQVKQIVGGTLEGAGKVHINFVSEHPAAWYAELYQRDGLPGGHVILLGPGNEDPARAALRAYP